MTTIDPHFIISSEIFDKCTKFANDSAGTSVGRYASRNQFNYLKITSDIRNGKISEAAVYDKVSVLIPGLTEPDYNVYLEKSKSWDPDLKDLNSNFKLAVKSQDIQSALLFGNSWVFQYREGASYDCDTGIFGKEIDENHYVSFVLLNVAKRTGNIKAIVKVKWLHDNKLFKPMQKQSLQNNKLAVYYDDLLEFKDNLWQV